MDKKKLVQAAFKMGIRQNDELLRKLAEVEREELAARRKGQVNRRETDN